jgi:hypothetical protein
MDTSVYDEKIEDLILKIDNIRQKMAPVLVTFLNETKIFVTNFYKDTIKEYVISNPDITKDYGSEGISDLKYECRKLIEMIPEMIEIYIGNEKFWSHKCPINDLKKECKVYPAFSTHYNKLDSNRSIIKSLRQILGYVGDLLLKYGYIKIGKYSDWKMSSDEKFTYNGSIECSDEMKDSLKNYLEMDKKLAGFISEINFIEKQKEEAKNECEAEEIWDNT